MWGFPWGPALWYFPEFESNFKFFEIQIKYKFLHWFSHILMAFFMAKGVCWGKKRENKVFQATFQDWRGVSTFLVCIVLPVHLLWIPITCKNQFRVSNHYHVIPLTRELSSEHGTSSLALIMNSWTWHQVYKQQNKNKSSVRLHQNLKLLCVPKDVSIDWRRPHTEWEKIFAIPNLIRG